MSGNVMARLGIAAAIAGALVLGAVQMAQPTGSVQASDVCPALDSGKIDTTGDPLTVTITAPAGNVITGYCVKAGSSNQNDGGPVFVTVDPPKTSVTISYPGGKAVSHYSYSFEPVTQPSDPTVPPTEPTVPPTEPTVPPTEPTTPPTQPTTPPTQPPTTPAPTTPLASTTTVVAVAGPTTTTPVATTVPTPPPSVASQPPPTALPQTGSENLVAFLVGLTLLLMGIGLVGISRRPGLN